MPAINTVEKIVTFFMVRIERSYQFRMQSMLRSVHAGEVSPLDMSGIDTRSVADSSRSCDNSSDAKARGEAAIIQPFAGSCDAGDVRAGARPLWRGAGSEEHPKQLCGRGHLRALPRGHRCHVREDWNGPLFLSCDVPESGGGGEERTLLP